MGIFATLRTQYHNISKWVAGGSAVAGAVAGGDLGFDRGYRSEKKQNGFPANREPVKGHTHEFVRKGVIHGSICAGIGGAVGGAAGYFWPVPAGIYAVNEWRKHVQEQRQQEASAEIPGRK